ncbi:peptidylprolyl isomerase [Pseudaeromonas paramecii]|uniref:Periplasmic chaperone PpiD n=2 Tax=Pseudaeromonas paramecii TaxID=2138166 RepID=A0ABP8PW02_9GAMM
MLMDKLREGAQGRIAKIIFWLIIFSFSLAGVGSYLNRPANTDPAEVNGEPITAQALENAYRNERSRLEAQLGENFAQLADNPAYLQRMRQGVLERMIDDVLVNQAIKDAKLRVGDEQVKKAILAMPYFQKDGKFDNDLYLAVLRQNNLTPEGFRDTVRQDLATQDYLGAVSQSEFALPAEARLLDRLLNQTRDVRLYTLPLAAFSGAVQVTDEERKAFYDAHHDQFMSQEQVAINYLLLDVDKIAAGISPSDADVQAYYDQHQDSYRTAERRKVAHILFAKQDADAQKKVDAELVKLKAGADFAALAKSDSADTLSARNGGELDWFEPGVMDPAFDKAAFALAKVGDLSQPVQSQFGYHIIKLLGVEPAKVKTLDEVKEQVRQQVKEDKAKEQFLDLQQQMADLSFENPDSLDEVATKLGLQVQQLALQPVSSNEFPLSNDKVKTQAFSVELRDQNTNSEVIALSDKQAAVIHVVDYKPAAVRPLDEVKAALDTAIKHDKALAAVQAEAAALLEKLKSGESVDAAVAAKQGKVETLAGVRRDDQKLDQQLASALFKLAKPVDGKPVYSQVGLFDGDQVLMALTAVHEADKDSANLSRLQASLQRNYGDAAYRAMLAQLRAKAKISYHQLDKVAE